jgi:hypothetical protein
MRVAMFLLLAIGYCSGVPAAERVAPSIYTCKVDGVVTFSDRPCGDAAQLHAIGESAINTYSAPAATPAAKSPGKSKVVPKLDPRSARADRAEAKRVENCARYARSLKEIRSKMRAGYSAKEGERLRARQDKLRDSQRSASCD